MKAPSKMKAPLKKCLMLLAALLVSSPAVSGVSMAAPVKVVASFSVLGDLVKEIGGGDVDVTTLVGPNGDVHVFEPTPADARAIKAAQLVVINGLGLEGWMPRLFQSTGYQGPVVVATEGILPRMGFGDGGLDPHAWQNVANVKRYVATIAEGLSKVDAAHHPDYQARLSTYLTKLEALETDVRAAFAAIPLGKRKIITSHDAFGYYGDAYGLLLLAPVGLSTEAEPSARTVASLIDQIRKEQVKAIFIENMNDPRLVKRIVEDAGATVGGELFSDALSPPEGPAATYLQMIHNNTVLITGALSRGD